MNRCHSFVTGLSLGLLAALAIGPLLLERRPVHIFEPFASTTATILSETIVLFLMLLALFARARLDRPSEPRAVRNIVLFASLAALMTLLHWIEVDRHPRPWDWQRDLYVRLFNHEYDAPHPYRPLPYGFVRLVERLTHDWTFACVSYRWFFTFWFVWASYRLARRYLNPNRSLLTLIPLVVLYPLSIAYYMGQLTDPLSHALFVLAFLYLLEDRSLALAAALALGVVAKETVVLVVPAYLACYWRRGWRAWFVTAGLGFVCVAAFLSTRLPLGWRLGYHKLNGTNGSMIGLNLGLGDASVNLPVLLWVNYLHPLLFVGLFVPFIAFGWRRIDPHLRIVCLTVTPLLLLSNVSFGWLYESRNYMPIVPLLCVASFMAWSRERRVSSQSGPNERQIIGT